MSKLIDLTGQRFGRLTVIEYAGIQHGNAYWKCKCDCNAEVTVRGICLRNGQQSCGCLQKEHSTTHGMTHTKLYRVWRGIKDRTSNPNCETYQYYGARGITIAPEWENDFQAFYDYVSKLPHFNEDGYSIDRIDVNGNYEPGNLRFATSKAQNRNYRRNIMVEYNGIRVCLLDAAKLSGVPYSALLGRYHRGDRDEHLFRPVRKIIPKSELVLVQNNQALTTSLKVAEYFEKEHFHVLRDIEEIIRQLAAETASGFDNLNLDFQKMFIKSEYEVKRQTRKYPMYLMNRDGFLLLVMGFTGQKAFHFKLEFIAEFNRMETALGKFALS